MINEALKACRELDSFNSYIFSGYATKRILSRPPSCMSLDNIKNGGNQSCKNWNFWLCKQFILPQ